MRSANSSVIINGIKVEQPVKQIYRRLGFNNHLTELDEKQKKKIDSVIAGAFAYCDLSGAFIRETVKYKDDARIELESGLIWESRDLSKFMDGIDEIYLIGATAGKGIIEFRDSFLNKDEIYDPVIIDAVGSEVVEACIEWIHDFIGKKIMIEGKKAMKRRFSPGYGDLSLEYQAGICEILEIDRIGVTLSPNHVLIPEKSVTAIIGITPK
jgi:hypothetical protein